MTADRDTSRAGDTRAFITEDALHVAPALIGLPLAPPWRRGAAMAVDGLLIAMLANAPGVLFGFAAALVLFRVSSPSVARAGYLRRSVRRGFRTAGAIILFFVIVQGWKSVSDRIQTEVIPSIEGDVEPAEARRASAPAGLTEAEWLRIGGGFLNFRRSRDERQARERAEQLVASLRRLGMEDVDIRNAVLDVADDVEDRPWLRAAADSALRRLALASEMPASDSLSILAARVRELNRRNQALTQRLAQVAREERQGLVARASTLIQDDLGLGLGWMGLYFTSTLALWQGRTPGKRLFRIRVVRLNGRPIGWWIAFERFGGYAAGVATGLLGFAQIFWDGNRQATHDRIAETAVVRD